MDQENERLRFAKLALYAGQRACASAAFVIALSFFESALCALGTNRWKKWYDLSLALCAASADAAFISRQSDVMELRIQEIMQEAHSLADQTPGWMTRIQAYMADHRMKEALEVSDAFLALAGKPQPRSGHPLLILWDLIQTRFALGRRSPESLAGLPEATDPLARGIQEISILAAFAQNAVRPEVVPRAILRDIRLALKDGVTGRGAQCWTGYGIILCAKFGKVALGLRFGELALAQARRFGHRSAEICITWILNSMIRPWAMPIKALIPLLRQSVTESQEAGCFTYGFYSALSADLLSYYAGHELGSLSEALEHTAKLHKRHHFVAGKPTLLSLRRVIDILTGKEAFIRPQNLGLNDGVEDNVSGFNTVILNLHLAMIFGDDRLAFDLANRDDPGLHNPTLGVLEFLFWSYALIALMAGVENGGMKPWRIWRRFHHGMRRLRAWVRHEPFSREFRISWVNAAKFRAYGKTLYALESYDQAIDQAQNAGFLHDAALICEQAADFCERIGKKRRAVFYRQEALAGYRQWGALAKVAQIKKNYHELFLSSTEPSTTDSHSSTSSVKGEHMLDLETVIRASRALSGEIRLDGLLRRLIDLAIENAGAEHGWLLIKFGDHWIIVAEAEAGKEAIRLDAKLDLDDDLSPLPTSLIRYTLRTQEHLVLTDAALDSPFVNDPYIQQKHPRSVLCLPLVDRQNLTGILYLENNLTPGAFTLDRLEILKTLSTHMAISIENALLYENLEQKVAERTQELRSSNQKLELAIEEVNAAKEKAELANQAKSAFLANMNHELRSPLNAIIGFAQLIVRSHTLPPEHQEHARIINHSGEHLLKLINQVLDLSKIESNQMTVQKNRVDLQGILQETQNLFSLKAAQKRLSLTFHCEENVPSFIWTDEVKLRQVLINLLSNALKFTQTGGIVVRVKTQDLHIPEMKPKLVFEVKDTGIGILANEMDKLFTAFSQTEGGRLAQEGTGLGLALSRKFVQLMGGDISVSSQMNQGTIFTFDIALDIAETIGAEAKKSTKRVLGRSPLHPTYRILIVDDQSDNRFLLSNLLKPLGFELREAQNGQEAVSIWRTWRPKLIWMDMRMPVMNGYDAARRIKSTKKGQTTIIIALTASGFEEERIEILKAGCDDYLRKPFKESELFELMEKHLKIRLVYEDAQPELILPPEHNLFKNVNDVASQIKALPLQIREPLIEAVELSDCTLIEREIHNVKIYDLDLFETLSNLAKNYDYDKLLELLKGA